MRQHADNPVEWYPWGPEALAVARAQDRPILLSVGYSACHWCHVMAHESFENPAIAAQMNEHFVNIKVDREERPDLDQLYQGVVQLMGRGGGWPLTVFLTPDLRPFYGGTYFPAHDRYGMPGFPRLLESLARAWKERRAEVEEQGQSFKEGLTRFAAYGLDAAPSAPVPEDIVAAGRKLAQSVDPVHGGFGDAPKFPNPMNVALLLRAYRRGARELWAPASLTLERMAEGGIYDQLGGGFHRYSVDAHWRVPHFEKMLYDNAQLLHLYSEAQQIEPRPLWKSVVEQTVAYVQREMTSPEGLFYAAQDADSEGEEGKFFVWTAGELDQLLPSDSAAAVKAHFGVLPQGNFEHGQNVLEVKTRLDSDTLREQVAAARAVLLQARARRVRPGLDDKALAGWNGLMIRGLAFAARVFGRDDWALAARRAADAALSSFWVGGRLFRAFQNGQPRIAAFAEDYGDLALGLTTLYQTTFEPRYLDAADQLVRQAMELFWDEEAQGYLAAPKGQADLLCPTYAVHDNAFPSGASTLTDAQVALAALTGAPEMLEYASRYASKMRDEMVRNPFAYGHLLLATDALVDGAAEVVVVGDRELLQDWWAAVRGVYAPTVAFSSKGSESVAPVLARTFEGKQAPAGKVVAYVCRNFACGAPLTTPGALADALQSSQLLGRS